MKRVVILILALIIVMPLLTHEFWIITDPSIRLNAINLKNLALKEDISEAEFNDAIKFLVDAH